MSNSKYSLTAIFLHLFCCGYYLSAVAQKDVTLDIKKPKKFENRVLGSDKTYTTKYTYPRRVMQGMSTHYNFFFNANIKINDIVTGAKMAFKDDFTQLLPFFNYTLDATAAQKTELDSVLMKCNAGILLHDLRNEWIDDMYLLMGKAYFFKKEIDSAALVFQYINYYFQPKEENELGYKKFIGSNLNDEGNVYSISTPEKRGTFKKMFTEPPVRNEALIWLLRSYIEDSAYGEAAGLIQTLQGDQYFPNRLKPQLEEMQAYFFYKKEMWDSCALHLIPALDNVENSLEKARREFLIAQLFALSKKNDEANNYYNFCIKHTVDPVMDVYARLHQIKLAEREQDEKIIQENIDALLKMARRDKYYNYRSIIYYMAAQMEMQRTNFENAKAMLLKSVKYNPEDMTQRNRSYLYLGNLAYDNRDYTLAYGAYDSLDINSPVVTDESGKISERKQSLSGVISRLETVRVEDSLMHIADMPEAEREKYLKAAAKRLRKERGLKEADSLGYNPNNPFANRTTADIFAGNQGKGEWYFYNSSLKSSGFSNFKSVWGNRPNIDNWRRQAAITAQANTLPKEMPTPGQEGLQNNEKASPQDISYEGLLKTVPLSDEARTASNDSIQTALFELGKIFKDKFEDYKEAIKNYEDLLNRYPHTPFQEEVIFDLHYCYTKLNMPIKARQYRDLLAQNFKQSKYIGYINDPKGMEERKTKMKNDATREYEKIYTLFIEGNFTEAVKQKAIADSTYGNIYWTQQLLYIEAIYHIKQKEDSLATLTLQNLIRINSGSGMAKKAENIIRVLKRRNEIEKYLTDLKVDRAPEDSAVEIPEIKKKGEQQQVASNEKPKVVEIKSPEQQLNKIVIDSSQFRKEVPKQSVYTFHPNDQHYVALLLNKVDAVFINEAKNAFNRYNRESFYSQQIAMEILPLNDQYKIVLMSGFADAASAMDYVKRTQPIAGSQIVPWLAADKYSFTVISQTNLEVLKTQKDLEAYKSFVKQNYPAEF
ncbi:MAG: hypothetical protein JST63_12185 [Bacteroidetes bacterium]|nr:hypothetical protein [Bacteroidota bacterium]